MSRSIREMGREIKDHRDNISSKAPLELLDSLELASDLMIACDPEIYIKMDGDFYCATLEDFIDFQESPAGFGDTPGEAIKDLYKAMEEAE